jgi:hypothetical protein
VREAEEEAAAAEVKFLVKQHPFLAFNLSPES